MKNRVQSEILQKISPVNICAPVLFVCIKTALEFLQSDCDTEDHLPPLPLFITIYL